MYFDGDFVPYDAAQLHILSTAVKYAAIVFEGIRAYWNESAGELYVFRGREHLERLAQSAKIARMNFPIPFEQAYDLLSETIRRNNWREDLHIRVQLMVTDADGLIDSTAPVALAISPMPMGRFPDSAGGAALRATISHWQRVSDNALPPRVKAVANYMNSRLALLQARAEGYDDAILLDTNGKVTEGPGWNIFLVTRGEVITPPVYGGILEGVTRDTLIRLAADLHGVSVTQRVIDKTELYLADEAFFCGSGREVKAISHIDGLRIGEPSPGPFTQAIARSYMAVARNENENYSDWCEAVYGS